MGQEMIKEIRNNIQEDDIAYIIKLQRLRCICSIIRRYPKALIRKVTDAKTTIRQ